MKSLINGNLGGRCEAVEQRDASGQEQCDVG